MTVNHAFFHASYARFITLRHFFASALKPLGYTEMMHPRDDLVAFGSNFPYFWLKRLDAEQNHFLTHIAFDAPSE